MFFEEGGEGEKNFCRRLEFGRNPDQASIVEKIQSGEAHADPVYFPALYPEKPGGGQPSAWVFAMMIVFFEPLRRSSVLSIGMNRYHSFSVYPEFSSSPGSGQKKTTAPFCQTVSEGPEGGLAVDGEPNGHRPPKKEREAGVEDGRGGGSEGSGVIVPRKV